VTARLRGGSVPSRSWRDNPTACAVLCATPDMWGSRLLFGGYGCRDEAKPREAGLLAFDSAVMVDEAHLARQLLVTARRVAKLALVAQQPLEGVPPLQVVEISATPAPDTSATVVTVAVDDDDLAEENLSARLTRPKPLTLVPMAAWPAQGPQVGKVATAVAQAVTAMRADIAPAEGAVHTIGCYVNTVPMALAVADLLRRASLRVVMVCGQARPADLARVDSRYPGILTTQGNGDVDVLVTTQSLEVGADLDLAGIVTELASGSALAQRAGRANRLGKRPSAPVTILTPPGQLSDKARSGPYSHEELNDALGWVTARAQAPLGLAPWAIRRSPPPSAHPRRRLFQRPELADAWHWARTSDALAADPELDLWLSDSFEDDTSIGLAVRDALPDNPADAIELVRDLPPAPQEAFSVPFRTARAILGELLDAGHIMVRMRGGEFESVRARLDGSPEIRPGDMVVIDSSAEIFTHVADGSFSPPVAAPRAADSADGVDAQHRGRADDVLHYQPDLRPGSVILRIEWSPGRDQIAGFPKDIARPILDATGQGLMDQPERMRRNSLAQLLDAVPDAHCPGELLPMLRAAESLLKERLDQCEVIWPPEIPGSEEEGARIVVLDGRKPVADEDLRQVFTRSDTPVLLRHHQCDVAERSRLLGTALGLPARLIDALDIAGGHHDDGKQDRRFQEIVLGHAGEGAPWAKSAPGKTRREMRRQQAEGGLPSGWRHEQRSVVDAWPAVRSASDIDPELALRLIGTSHGHGRAGFPHTAAELTGSQDSPEWHELAADLFDSGGWDELIEATHIRYGAWGCGFLEAVLRAGDCQVSGEGK
jgi:CRISPR-associated endonuclease/helicase Cas3